MEKRSAARWILLAGGLGVAAAIAVLLFKVHGRSPEPELDPAELARAQRSDLAAPAAARPAPGTPRSVPGESQELFDRWSGEPDSDDTGQERFGSQRLAAAASGGGEEDSDPAEVPKLMTEATRLYDRGDYLGAQTVAEQALERQPDNVKLLRVAVSASCIVGDPDKAATYYQRLPPRDQRQMARRCRRYGIEF
jgi:hypothetical protein